jgi:hypothetical protein
MPDPMTAPLNVVAPDLSGMSQPGPNAITSGPMPAPTAPAPPTEALTPGMAAPDITDRSINPAVPPAPPKGGTPVGTPDVGGHTRLLAMISGLASGLGALGTSIATKGQRGGVQQVLEDQAREQEMKIQAQQAAQAKTNAQLQNQLTTGEIARLNTQNYILGSTWHDEVDQSHFKTQEAQQNIKKSALDIDTAVAGYQRENFGLMPPSQVPGGLNVPGAAVAPVTPDGRARVQTSLGSAINLATGVLGTTQDSTLSAAIDKAKAVVANPNSSRADIMGAGQGLTNALQANKAVTASRKEQSEASTAETTAANAPAKSAADIALANARTAAAKTSTEKTNEELKSLRTGNSNLSGPDYLKSLPASRASNVQAFGEGRAQVNSRSFATPAGQALLSDITAAYPDYDQSKAITWDKTRNEYTGSGATAKKAVSYNTALEHMQDLYNNSTKEGLYLPGSKAYSDRSVALGYVSNEVGNAIKNGVMSKDEGAQILDSLKGWTPSTAKERVAETARLLYDKIEEYQTKFADAAPSSAVKVPTLISPKAQAAYNFVEGINQAPAAMTPAAPAGATGKAYPKGQTSGPQYWHDANGKNLGLVQ